MRRSVEASLASGGGAILARRPRHLRADGPRSSALLAALAFVLGLVAFAPIARAQPAVDEVEESYRRGRFRDALDAAQRAMGSARLEEPGLARLLELTALSHHALGDHDAMERALSWLAALDPTPSLSSAAPPPVAAAYAEARSRAMQVDLSIVEASGGRRVELTVANAPDGFVRELHLRVRFDGGPWQEASSRIDVPRAAHTVQGYAWVVGPAGVETHQIGSPRRPLPLIGVPAVALEPAPPPARSDDTLLWGLVTTGIVAVVVAAAIAIGFVLTEPPDDTVLLPSGP